MSHNSDGRIYTEIVGGVQKGISITDIQSVLGSGKTDIGSLIRATDLDSNPLVNPFAKFKPIRNSTLGIVTAAQRLQALYGTSIVQCGRLDYPNRYAEKWGFNAPRGKGGGSQGYDEWYRFLDFDGYQHNRWPEVRSQGFLRTIFYAQLSIPGSTIAALDTIIFDLQCRENDDADAYLGLLYPYDFVGADSPYDISAYYMGIAVVDNINAGASIPRNVYVISGPHISDYFNMQGYHVYATMRAQLPASVTNGAVVIAPVLLQNNTVPSGGSEPAWTDSYNGTIVNLNGAYLSANKTQDNYNVDVEFNNVVLGQDSLDFDITIRNTTGDLVTISTMVGYLLSDDSEMNEHSSLPGYSGPDYVHPSTGNYIQTEWPSYKQNDIYTHDRTGRAENPDELCARYIMEESGIPKNLYRAFLDANNGDDRIGHTGSVTFHITMNRNMVVNGYVGDDFGPYSDGLWLYLGLHVNQFSTMRQYQII